MKAEPEAITIVLIKSYWETYIQSIAWLVVLAGAMSFAVWIDSSAMQWVMAFFWFFTLIGWAAGQRKRLSRTPEDAITEIQAMTEPDNGT